MFGIDMTLYTYILVLKEIHPIIKSENLNIRLTNNPIGKNMNYKLFFTFAGGSRLD